MEFRNNRAAGKEGSVFLLLLVFPLAKINPIKWTKTMGRENEDRIQKVFMDNLGLIDDIVSKVCRRSNLNAPDVDDFKSEVYLYLIRDDYAVFRKFEGRSSLKTYLTTTVTRRFLDLMRKTGRWRPSTAARRSGETAILIDRLITKERWSEDEAYRILRINYQLDISRRDFDKTVATLPRRPPRVRLEPWDGLSRARHFAVAARELSKQSGKSGRMTEKVLSLVAKLAPEDRLILRLRFRQGMLLSSIARTLGCKYKAIYSRFNRVLAQLRCEAELLGLDKPT